MSERRRADDDVAPAPRALEPHVHEHARPGGRQRRARLTASLVLAAAYMAAEVAGGIASNSLALLADAGHMLTDVAALGLALFALWLAGRPATAERTYGHHRVEILAAMANSATLIGVSLVVIVEAVRRWANPPPVRGGLMLAVAVGGLVVNLAMLAILHAGRGENLNLRGAWLHVATDALGSAQAIGAAALITSFGWYWSDPVASILIGALVMLSAWALLRESLDVLMEGVPKGLDLESIRASIAAVPGVATVHDLHVWTIGSGFVALSTHVVVQPGCSDEVLWRIRESLRDRFGIEHSTIQVERRSPPQAIRAAAEER